MDHFTDKLLVDYINICLCWYYGYVGVFYL